MLSTTTNIPSLLRRASILTAIAAAILAFAAASSASAQRVRICSPTGCFSVCRQFLPNGNIVDYGEGTQITVTDTDGTKHKYTCKDGEWVPTRTLPPTSGIVAPVGGVQSSPQGTLPSVQGIKATFSPRVAR